MKPQLTALVTGASFGIGLACAEELADLGYHVFGASRTSPASQRPIEWLAMDVTSDESVSRGITRIIELRGSIDLVVNNAGYAIAGAIEDSTVVDAREQFETNFFGVYRVCRSVIPNMRARCSGLIVNISSLGGLFGLPFQGLYSASKFAVEGYTETLRLEMRPFGVRVVLIEPGDVRNTAITRTRRHASGSKDNAAYRDSFLGALRIIEKEERNGTAPEKVAATLRHVLSQRNPRLRYTVGHLSQRSAAFAKRFLSWRLFEKIISYHYGVR